MTKGTSMKRQCFVSSGLLLLVVLLLSTQITVVHCRALRSATSAVNAGCQQEDVAHQSASGVASFSVSSNNSDGGGPFVRSWMFQLASGPSKKGPGH
ncbi:hypothetical protein P3X46_021066 [Hevea brasiliensis]|uniref:Uncharacterized protein n=1 Tax=Hevea brasiliensis TaxID=3981 RepID=A0ABQ9LEA4_HEVBR|nr:hypothetical protein P3X46_021066 [Hevea brasiliensis]